ncbi:hypothetical protein WJX81_006396 [Elliptochloris bilobata]|uniref:Mitochondrial import inner membrane translocase subunit Tim17/Tim22/Tim23 family protein n=1 Tax=Elliptochloris bilobata TaxID=381761 RepID=A0AAW1R3P7_9CHLO
MLEEARHEWRNPKKLLGHFNGWVASQPPYIEAIVATIGGGGQGAFLGAVMGQMTKLDPNVTNQLMNQPNANPDMVKQMQAFQTGGPTVQARNFAVMTGVNAGLAVAVRRWGKGKVDETYGTMIAAFGSGVAFSLVSGMAGGGNPLQGAFTTGVFFALFQGAFHKLGQRFGGGKQDAPEYARGSYLLRTLGMQKYEQCLKRGKLTDSTIMLWNDAALQEARMPPGPRLLLLHHLERYKYVLKPGMPAPGAPPLPPQAAPPAQAAPQAAPVKQHKRPSPAIL